MLEAVARLCQYTGLMVSCLLLLPWCIVFAGYWICSNKSYIQQLSTASYMYKQASKWLLEVSLQVRVKTTTRGVYAWQFKYANTMPTVLCFSNGLLCGNTASIYFCLWTKGHITCHMKFALLHWNFTNIHYLIYYMHTIWWLYVPMIIPNLCYVYLVGMIHLCRVSYR